MEQAPRIFEIALPITLRNASDSLCWIKAATMTVSSSHSAPAVRRAIRTDGMPRRADRMAVWLMNVPVPILKEGEAGYEGGGVVENCVDGKYGLESGNSATCASCAFFTLLAL
jgi:hypothetical protein